MPNTHSEALSGDNKTCQCPCLAQMKRCARGWVRPVKKHICACTHTHTHTHTYTHTHNVHVHTPTHTHTHTQCARTHTHAHKRTCRRRRACMHTHTHKENWKINKKNSKCSSNPYSSHQYQTSLQLFLLHNQPSQKLGFRSPTLNEGPGH